ncbi:MAG: alpha/beta hydrolase [Capnocytophaga sp.]|nr:alpha/beta hydrolase [Capnocytophaga sp.]
METTHIYCMPGLGATYKIFENLIFPDNFQVHFLDWEEPNETETLQEYAKRFAEKIKYPKPILIGVSFGGILVQEIATNIQDYTCLVLISTIKSTEERPKWANFYKKAKLSSFLPIKYIASLELWKKTKRYERLYKKYIGLLSPNYLSWSIKQITEWQQTAPLLKTIHIHGNKDAIFPIEKIKNPTIVENGTHIMIINRYRWFNEHLISLLEPYLHN